MTPSATSQETAYCDKSGVTANSNHASSAVIHRSLNQEPPLIVSANDKSLALSNGHTVLDTSCGAGVACLGYNNRRVRDAMVAQIDKFCYCNSMFFGHRAEEELAAELIGGTGGAMSKAYFMCSGKSYTTQPSAPEDNSDKNTRVRGDGSGDEDGPPVLHGTHAPGTETRQLHREEGLISRRDARLPLSERTRLASTAL